jgi:uroporphyrinogen-III synthase
MAYPLQGLRVLNTRPLHQAQALNQMIQALGGTVIHCPALEIVPVSTAWEKTLSFPLSYEIAFFSSTNAVHYFFKRIPAHLWPKTLLTLAIGPTTSQALLEKGITAQQSNGTTTETLLQHPCLQHLTHQRLLIIKGKEGRTLLTQTLMARNAMIEELEVYERILPTISPLFIKEIWQDDRIDIILFTSQQAMEQLFTMFGKEAYSWLQTKPCLVISPRLANIAQAMGIKRVFMTSPHQLPEGLISAYNIMTQGRDHD